MVKLSKTQFAKGIWEGILHGAGDTLPALQVTYLGDPVEGLHVEPDNEEHIWHVSFSVPVHLIGDGVQTFVIRDGTGTVLNSITLMAGDALAEDIRAELALLRSELDILKQSFRRHCNES